ncbi:MAG: hypothetical protein H6Q15_858 [Bacteroidetes bacterium]|nr:hypothetical protein [Bacteroidota bacterium]
MKKRNIFYILSIFVLSSIFMATSCKDDDKDNNNKPTPPTPTENPMYKNKINELRSYIGISDAAFKAIMTDSLGLVEDVFVDGQGKKISYYSPEPIVFVYEVFINTYLDKVYGVRFYHWLDYDTLVRYYEGYSKEYLKTIPLNYNYDGEIYGKDGSEYTTIDRNDYQIQFQSKKDILYFCGERYFKDSIYNLVAYEDSTSNLNHSWVLIGSVDLNLEHNPYPKKNKNSFLNYKSPFFRKK